jgi:hypothetical protein
MEEKFDFHFLGIPIANGKYTGQFESSDSYHEVIFYLPELQKYNGQCLEVNLSEQTLTVWSIEGEELWKDEIINIPSFRQKLLIKLQS